MGGNRVNTKLLLVTLILGLIALLLLNYFFKNNRVDGVWNYAKIDKVNTIINQGERTNDREVYYNMESIIKQYMNSYLIDESEEDNMNYMDYYNYLTDYYKTYLSKSEYKEVADNFFSKFYVQTESQYERTTFMDVEGIIQSIYEYADNTYLCELKSSYNNTIGYFAARINIQENQFYIVYVE